MGEVPGATARLVASAVVRDAAGQVLIVKPTYRDGWLLPGGGGHAGESPRLTAIREVHEETGLLVDCTRLLVTDFLPGKDGPSPKADLVQQVFDGGTVADALLPTMRVHEGEIERWRFVPAAEALALVRPNQQRLLAAALDALEAGSARGLERGAPIDGPTVFRPSAARTNERVVFIGGNGHSGSTLLGLLLGSHPEALYGGELRKSRVDVPAHKRRCRRCGDDCAVWAGIRDDLGGDVYEQLSQRTGRPTIVDSTKLLRWIEAEGRRLRLGGVETVLIHLRRDGRGVVNSRLRKRPESDPATVIQAYLERAAATDELLARWKGPTATVHYEALASDPAATLQALCRDIGLPFDEAMLRYDEREHHAISGNAGTHTATLAVQGQAVEALAERPDFYRETAGAIRLDERWRTELDPAVLDLYETIAGAR